MCSAIQSDPLNCISRATYAAPSQTTYAIIG